MKYLAAIEKLKTSQSIWEIESSFQEIAHALLNQTQLLIRNENFKLMEIEFYFDNGSTFQDPYIHGDDRQKTTNNWYFHRKGEGYSDGKIKGLDLTFGNNPTLGGILLRGIENLHTGEYIDGPSRIVNKILEMNGVEKVCEIAPQLERLSANDPSNALQLKEYENPVFQIPTKCPRVGLTLKTKKEALQRNFIMKNYRFLAEPAKTGIHNHSIFLALVHQGMDKNKAREIAGIREAEALKYFFNYCRGAERHYSGYVDMDFSVLNHCEMMGAILGYTKRLHP